MYYAPCSLKVDLPSNNCCLGVYTYKYSTQCHIQCSNKCHGALVALRVEIHRMKDITIGHVLVAFQI